MMLCRLNILIFAFLSLVRLDVLGYLRRPLQCAVAAVADVAVKLFEPTAGSILMAIYKASGYSSACCHWKMSFEPIA